jgi:glycerol-3-phosphate dehydrogenase subunit C
MPKLELGDLEAVEKYKERNIPVLAKLAAGLRHRHAGAVLHADVQAGTAADVPRRCALQAVSRQAMFDPFEYFVLRHKDGLLKTDFKVPLGKVSYHIPCHGRVQNIGKKTEEMLKLTGRPTVNTVERCSPATTAPGASRGALPLAMKIGKPVFKAMAKDEPDYISSDCAMAGHHIARACTQAGTPAKALQHPLTLLRIAYGID